ncbi:MAG TPA: N-acetylglucosamine-6-phosphate deacetylase [Candidatus Dormibacteraeota bacterium]|nr:N-acetylglucosamine-6-phosphate deacetylase [Candidatus Dormibacteraeota bacterium]
MKTLFRGAVHGVPAADGVLTDGAVIAWVGKGSPPERPDEEIVLDGGELLAPGFIDLQVNGFRGRDAAEGGDAIAAISAALPSTGVTAFLPTLISSPVAAGAEFAGAVATAEELGARVLGAHIEGPFINPSFRGAHDPDLLAVPTTAQVEVIARAKPRLVTLAPELPGGLEAIVRLRRAGVIVSAGHTGADFDQGRKAVDAGVRFGTHVFNAMPPIHHRRPGIALALMLDRRVTVGLIADGEHVHPAVIRELLAVKGPARIALTTDQTAAAGAGAGSFALSGRTVVSDGTVVRLEDGTLAGSASTMEDLVRRSVAIPGMSLARVVSMATAVPARVLGEKLLGRIGVGACADLVLLDHEQRVRLTMVAGRVRFRR